MNVNCVGLATCFGLSCLCTATVMSFTSKVFFLSSVPPSFMALEIRNNYTTALGINLNNFRANKVFNLIEDIKCNQAKSKLKLKALAKRRWKSMQVRARSEF